MHHPYDSSSSSSLFVDFERSAVLDRIEQLRVLQFDVLIEQTLRPLRLLAVFHLAFVVALDLRGVPANTPVSLLVHAVHSISQVVYSLLNGAVVLLPAFEACSQAQFGHSGVP